MTRKEMSDIFKPELGKIVTRRERLEDCEGQIYGRLEIVYHGSYEQPDIWLITWEHYRSFLLDNIPAYLVRFFPGKDGKKFCTHIVKLLKG